MTAVPILGEDRPLTDEEKRALIRRGDVLIAEAALWPRAAGARAWRTFVRTIRRDWRSLLAVGVATWVVAVAVNMALVAFVFGRDVESGAPVVAPGNALAGAGFATAVTVVVTTIVGYRLRAGKQRFWAELRSLPELVVHARSADAGHTATHLLWGFAGTMLVVVWFTPAMVGVLAVGSVLLLAGPARALLNALALAAWRVVGGRLLPNRVAPPAPVAVLVGAFGTALAFAGGAVLTGAMSRLAAAALAAVVAILLARRPPVRAAAATAAVLLALSPLAALTTAGSAGAVEEKPETGTLTGSVKDVRRGGVAAVEVVASGPDGKKATTAADGTYELRGLERGTYRVTVRDPKDDRVTFLPDYLDVDLGERAVADFQLKPAAAGTGDDGSGASSTTETTEATSTTASPTSTTPKTPRTLSSGSTVVADFVVKAPVRKLRPAPRPTPEEAAQAGSATKLPSPPTTAKAKPGAPPPTAPRPTPPPTSRQRPTTPPFQLPASPIFADCRDVVGRACAPKAGYVEFTLSRRILKVGQRVTGNVSFELVYDEEAHQKCLARQASGGVERCPVYSWSWAPPTGMAAIGGSPAKATKNVVSVAGKEYPVVECESGKELASATCEWIVTSATGGWVTNTGAVLEGFASGSFLDADFYAVIPGDVAVIEGTVRDQFGQPVPGVTVHMDGDQKYAAVTDASGWYFQVVEPGDYEIYAEVDAGFDFGLGEPDIVPERHKTKLTVPEDGEAPTADLEVERDPCAGSLLDRLRCLADPGLLALAGIMLAPLVPVSIAAQGAANTLADLESPLSDKLDELSKWLDELPHVPDFRDYPPFDPAAENHLEVYDRIKEDWMQFLRESNPGKTWPEIMRNHDIEQEVNRLYGKWLITDYAGKPLRAAEQASWDVQGFLAGVKEDWELGGFWKRAAELPDAAQDILFGPVDQKTGKRGWFGGLLKPLAEDIEKHGPFAVLTAGGKFALATVDAVFGASDLGTWSALDEATRGMTEKQRNQYLYDHADEVPGLYGLQLRWQKAVDAGDNKAIAALAIDLANNVAGDLDGRSKNGMTMTAAEKAARDLELDEAARRQTYRDRHGHHEENTLDPSDATPAAAGATLADEALDATTETTKRTTTKNWAEVDPYARPPMSVRQIEAAFRDLEPGERLKLTAQEAAAWGGYEQQMLHDMWANSLQHGTGTAAGDKPWVELKRGNEDALRRRQEGYHEGLERFEYNLKPNHIKSKSLLAEELAYLPRDMDDVQAGEVVSYNPTRIPAEGEVAPEVRQRLIDRRTEWEKLQAGGQPTTGSGPVIDRYGRQVAGEAELHPDGRWYTRQQVPDAAGRRPYDPGYEDTWSGWTRTAGDNDTFAMGAGGELMHGIDSREALDATYRLADGTTRQGWQLTTHERLTYAAAGAAVPGEGNTPFNWTPASPDFNQAVYDQTLQRAADEGVLLVDADGFFLTRPGAHYDR